MSNGKIEHTELPWAADPDDREGMEWNVHIVEATRPHMRICFLSNGEKSQANAALIVSSVNAVPELVKALEEIEKIECGPVGKAAQIARAALAAYRSRG